ncbi:RNA polymerase sigma-70 factor [Pedobacter hartonius]|uniref:RNA polymerase sigma-70 factor, ECF subfamily n=1 Tax=Pedobacter hartonius TaxID=425514 RepID=A0A1H4FU16_9SPHI|nr:RNA polymerase sigma-70 factor [Pedobacter hartonius]SEB00849.1 RNA polymerase sigma-70 factor, ECF subfamily [Pedobacter hartonius]
MNGEIDAFEQVYQFYWSDLYRYAYNILRNKLICEEIVQETFFSLWTKRKDLKITHSIGAYLFTAVKFQTINYIRSEKVKRDYASNYANFKASYVDNSNEEHIHLSDLKSLIENEVSKLPEKCQKIFRMSRNEHQSIKSIADLLNISHKTVENQLTKALRQLRTSLGQFFSLTIMLLIFC